MGMKGMITGIAGMSIAAAGTVYAMGKLSGMDSEEIRSKGEAAVEKLHAVSDKIANSGIGQDINKKMQEYPFTKSIANVLGKGVSGTIDGFGKFVDVLSDAKAKSELDGSDFSKNLAGGIGTGLKSAVSSVADFVNDKFTGLEPAADNGPAVAAADVNGPDAEPEYY